MKIEPVIIFLLSAMFPAHGSAAADEARMLRKSKVQVCHIPPGNPANFRTLEVGQPALEAHLGHGDLSGSCNEHCPSICDNGSTCQKPVDNGACEDVGCEYEPQGVAVSCSLLKDGEVIGVVSSTSNENLLDTGVFDPTACYSVTCETFEESQHTKFDLFGSEGNEALQVSEGGCFVAGQPLEEFDIEVTVLSEPGESGLLCGSQTFAFSFPTEAPSASPSEQPTGAPSPSPSSPPTEIPCGGPCDDGDLCTIDTCDILSNTCKAESVVCGSRETCDPFTGLCQDTQNVVPCVAVIDEWNNRNYDAEWTIFRNTYPQRPFCLLVPNTSVQRLPAGFDEDTVNNPDGIDRTTVVTVNRDNGNTGLVSDWFNLCGLDILSPSSITFLGLFIDTSGSMTLNTVRASFDEFTEDIENAGIQYDQVFNGAERWIDPFFTELRPPNFLTPGPTAPPTSSPTDALSPSPGPTSSPTKAPSPVPTRLPTDVPSPPPSGTQTTSPDTSVPTGVPTSVPTSEPTGAPTPTPTPAPSNAPTDSPTGTPSAAPTEEPQAVASPLRLLLSTGATTAGDSILLEAEFLDENGDMVEPVPPLAYEIAFAATEASGTAPVVSSTGTGGTVIDTSLDTRGVYTVRATVAGEPLSVAEEDFAVFRPASNSTMMSRYTGLSTAVNGVAKTTRSLGQAFIDSDDAAIQTALDDMRAFRDTVDLEDLRPTAICAPEGGFFPTPGQLTESGYPAEPDDPVFASVIEALAANFLSFSQALESNADAATLAQLNEDAELLIEQYRTLSPSVHGWVLAQSDLNFLYAVVHPRLLHALVDSFETETLAEFPGVNRRLGSNPGQKHRRTFITAVALQGSLRAEQMTEVFQPVVHNLLRSIVVMQIGSLLQSINNSLALGGIITGASLSFFTFEQSNSVIEVSGSYDAKYPIRYDVQLIGTSAVAAAEGLLDSLDPRGVNFSDLDEAFEYFEKFKKEVEKVAGEADKANQWADQFGGTCILTGGGCKPLIFDNGFQVVNTCEGFLCFPQPVLFLVTNSDTGEFAQGIYNFAYT